MCYSFWIALRFLKDERGAIFRPYNMIDTCLRLKKIIMSNSGFLIGIYFGVQNEFCMNKYFLIEG